MNTLTMENANLLTKQLSEALIKFSEGKVPSATARKIAEIALDNVDFMDSTLSHKGINWYAKDLLKKLNI